MHCVYFAWRKETDSFAHADHPLCSIWAAHGGYCLAVDRIISVEHGTRAALELLRVPYILCVVHYGLVDTYEKKAFHPSITLCASLIALFLMGFASISPSVEKKIEPLVPALQSNWLHIHVATCFIAYAAFAISFIAGTLYLVGQKGPMPPRDDFGGNKL